MIRQMIIYFICFASWLNEIPLQGRVPSNWQLSIVRCNRPPSCLKTELTKLLSNIRYHHSFVWWLARQSYWCMIELWHNCYTLPCINRPLKPRLFNCSLRQKENSHPTTSASSLWVLIDKLTNFAYN